MAPPMPKGFTDQTAWDVIHWKFSDNGTSTLDQLVIDWQKNNQDRVKAAIKAEAINNLTTVLPLSAEDRKLPWATDSIPYSGDVRGDAQMDEALDEVGSRD